ncbi:MAG TPA: helix-turn-helix transcriptional regulator [Sphingomicrobium sp.]
MPQPTTQLHSGAEPGGHLPFLSSDWTGRRYISETGRRLLHHSELGSAEEIAIAAGDREPFGYSAHFRLAVTYIGAAQWKVGPSESIIDANTLLTLEAGDEYDERQIGDPCGRASIVLTMAPHIVEEARDGLRRSRSRRSVGSPLGMAARLNAHWLLHSKTGLPANDLLALDEAMLACFLSAQADRHQSCARFPSLLVERTKDLLHSANGNSAAGLTEIAQQVGCSPVYLTQLFRAHEGIPLHQYRLRLRLGRALLALRRCDDITGLGLDLGFSSHSHFTATFSRAFGMTPSAYRNMIH